MKLGIAVVYMVSERNERLLDLHLNQIEKNTTIPYTIYAATNRLLPRFRAKLEAHPRVKICPCETYVPGSGLLSHERGGAAVKGGVHQDCKYEHSWYLEQLIGQAIDDGVTHVAIFHVDSFPVRFGWDEELIDRLTDQCVLAGAVRDEKGDRKPLTAAILFPREFYLKYAPRLLLGEGELNSADYRRYFEACPHRADSGFGYGFRMFMEGLTWYPLLPSNGGHHTMFGSVHADMIFHLMATAVVDQQNVVDYAVRLSQRRGPVGAVARLSTIVLPVGLRRRLRGYFSKRVTKWYQSDDREEWERERALLLEDPEMYLDSLRGAAQRQPSPPPRREVIAVQEPVVRRTRERIDLAGPHASSNAAASEKVSR